LRTDISGARGPAVAIGGFAGTWSASLAAQMQSRQQCHSISIFPLYGTGPGLNGNLIISIIVCARCNYHVFDIHYQITRFSACCRHQKRRHHCQNTKKLRT